MAFLASAEQTAEAASARVPGRVNLIGEHTDYNGGAVLPMLIGRTVTVTLRPHGPDEDRIASGEFDTVVRSARDFALHGDWSDYAAAALAFARLRGFAEGGYDLRIESDIPVGAGVSSSAALLVAILKAVSKQGGLGLPEDDIALMAQAIENDLIGVPCGIMDQMAVACGRPGWAMYLDTATLERRFVQLFESASFVTFHSGVERALNDGRYAERRAECEAAAAALGTQFLCKPTPEAERRLTDLPDPLRRRARHQVSEHRRVLAAFDALEREDAGAFGALMNESHASMRDDFEVSHPEIDRLTEAARTAGAMGSRMTGGGFGGCFVSLVPNEVVPAFERRMSGQFPKIARI